MRSQAKPEKKTARLAAKLNKPPELVVFEKVSDEGKCNECGAELLKGDYLLVVEHTGRRNSGRVGRSAAGRALDSSAVALAVIAHIRHEHTNYDELLMRGTERLDARAQVRERIERVLAEWSDV